VIAHHDVGAVDDDLPCFSSPLATLSMTIFTPGIALPTLPIFWPPGRFAVAMGLVSVRP
jgi:hypothetical protein